MCECELLSEESRCNRKKCVKSMKKVFATASFVTTGDNSYIYKNKKVSAKKGGGGVS